MSDGACAACGAALGPGLLACPACGRLVHAARLADLSQSAEAHELAGRWGDALAAWREAVSLLPPTAPQSAQVGERIEAILARPEARRDPSLRRRAGWGGAAGIGLAGLLLAGLLKAPALLGLLGMFGVLWAAYGWKLAAGVLAGLYLHELGHALAMHWRGLPVSAPMFLPGIGAYVRMTERPATAREEARIGLAGPAAGLAACGIAWAAGALVPSPLFLAIASVGALINLLNLCPVWHLDGRRAFESLSRAQRAAATASFLVLFAATREGALLLPLATGAWATAVTKAPARGDARGLAALVAIAAGLAALAAAAPLG